MRRDYRLYLDDILDAIHQIRSYVQGQDEQAFASDRKTQDAVIRNLEIIGEAPARLSETSRVRDSEVPWREIIGMRNMLIHGYFDVDREQVWKALERDLPALR